MVNNLFKSLPFSIDIVENILGDFSLLRCCGAAKVIKITVKPVIDLLVDLVVVVAYFLAGFPFLLGFGLSCGTILVSAANVNGVVTNKAAVASEDVG